MGTSKKYRFHLLGLVHLPCSKTYMSCAFTQKNYKLARMLLSLGHEVYYYGAEGSDVPCTKFIQTHTLSDIRNDYGSGDDRFEIGYDWTSSNFRHDFATERKPSTLKYYANAIAAINEVKRSDDFLLCSMGLYHEAIAREVNIYLTCESGMVELTVAEEKWRLQAGDVVVFRGDQKHAYRNPGTISAVAYSVLSLAAAT